MVSIVWNYSNYQSSKWVCSGVSTWWFIQHTEPERDYTESSESIIYLLQPLAQGRLVNNDGNNQINVTAARVHCWLLQQAPPKALYPTGRGGGIKSRAFISPEANGVHTSSVLVTIQRPREANLHQYGSWSGGVVHFKLLLHASRLQQEKQHQLGVEVGNVREQTSRNNWTVHWNKRQDNHHLAIAKLLLTSEAECVDPYVQLIPYFCGNHEKCRQKQHWKWALERAKKNVQNNFAFIGLLEDEALSIKLLEWTLPTFFTGAADVYRKRSADLMRRSKTSNKPHVTDWAKEYLKAQLAPEYELYQLIKRIFYYKIAKLGFEDISPIH